MGSKRAQVSFTRVAAPSLNITFILNPCYMDIDIFYNIMTA